MALTAIQVKNLKPTDKNIWVSDQKGLRLLIKPNGSKYWQLKYRYKEKQKTLALGVYPEVSLADARLQAERARGYLAENIDPSAIKKATKHNYYGDDPESLNAVAYEWWKNQKESWKSGHANRVWVRLKDNALISLGARPIKSITPLEIISVIRSIEDRGALDVAARVKQDLGRVGRYAVQTGRIDFNPASDLAGVLKVRKKGHVPSLPREEIHLFLKTVKEPNSPGRNLTKLGIELLVNTFVRPGELRQAKWQEFDLEKREWRIPAERMKMGTEHIVPLSRQTLKILSLIKEISGENEFVFPSETNKKKPISDNAMRTAIFRLGYDGKQKGKSKVTPHGFRATASSILNEENFNPDAIERQLSHMERNGVRAAYIHHAQFMNERKIIMQWWSDYLENKLK